MTWHQSIQDRAERRGHKRLARRIWRARLRWFIWRGQVQSVRVGEDETS